MTVQDYFLNPTTIDVIHDKGGDKNVPISKNVNQTIVITGVLGVLLAGFLTFSSDSMAAMPEQINAFYLPSHSFTERKISEYIHYAELAGLNAAVLHVKDPHG